MGIKVILQTAAGKKVGEVLDPDYSLAEVWPVGNRSFSLLQYIDPYGNAIFNGLQMPEVQKELDALMTRASNDEQRETLLRIRHLAELCHERPHMLLRFRGD
jgi:hypothetical protein